MRRAVENGSAINDSGGGKDCKLADTHSENPSSLCRAVQILA
jgi:hypothetical protein